MRNEYRDFIKLLCSEEFDLLDKKEQEKVKKQILITKNEMKSEAEIIETAKTYADINSARYDERFEIGLLRCFELLSKEGKTEVAKAYFENTDAKYMNIEIIFVFFKATINDEEKAMIISCANKLQIYKILADINKEKRNYFPGKIKSMYKKYYNICAEVLEKKDWK